MSHLLTFRHLREIKSAQGKFDYQRKEKESNEGDLIINGKKKRAMRETWLSKERKREQWGRFDCQSTCTLSLSLSSAHTHHPAEREGAQKTSFQKKYWKKLTLALLNFFWWFLPKLVSLNI